MDSNPPVAAKRSLFKKPTWAATSASHDTNGDFFRQRESTYKGILAEQKVQRRRQVAKENSRADEGAQSRESKRRRISEDRDSDSTLDSDRSQNGVYDGVAAEKSKQEDLEKTHTPTRERTSMRLGNARSPSLAESVSPLKPSSPAKATIINLADDDDEDDDGTMPNSPTNTRKSNLQKPESKALSSDPESEEEDDEYTRELKRKARERERARKLGIETATSTTRNAAPIKSQTSFLAAQSHKSSLHSPIQHSQESSQTPNSPRRSDPIRVQILIRPAIPGTDPLIVNRFATQNLQQVKLAWCKRQGFDAAQTSKVILTWRGQKLWNTSTCIHILKTLREEREERQKSGLGKMDLVEDSSSVADPSHGRIEVEAVTEEILEERRRAKEKEKGGTDGQDEDGQTTEGVESESRPPKEPEAVIQLKSPGLVELTLKVRPSTPIAKIMAGFKKIRKVDEWKTCWLIFDGERLEPEATVGQTEIEDGDTIDVQIR